ncbi:hypothetical protein BDN71DRAFT_531899 [Pleurotus eryngii]|uniref:Uncharacterized protein n=1 Tax=Pleurotus eryngii TaxID=5323 RepID=A0A9P6A2F8_PLEER|nr:hypothetical protein BDN71DRAFT_531899 [Pleurotus eryngii]
MSSTSNHLTPKHAIPQPTHHLTFLLLSHHTMSAEPYTVWKTGTEVLSLIGLGTVFWLVFLGSVAFIVACYMGYQRIWGKKKVARRAPRAASAGTPKPKATPRRRVAAAPSLMPHFHIPATESVRNLLTHHYGAAPVQTTPATGR